MKRLVSSKTLLSTMRMAALLLGGVFLGLALSDRAQAASAWDVENNLPNARSQIVNVERDKWNDLRNCLNGGGEQRHCVNIKAAYTEFLSIMTRDGSATSIEVDAGTKRVDLRIKSLLFYNFPLVTPSWQSAWIDYGSAQVVRDDNFPNDRQINKFCGSGGSTYINCPAMSRVGWNVSRVYAVNDSSVRIEGGTGQTITPRSLSSRYLFGNDIYLSAVSDQGFTANKTITIRAEYQAMNEYYNNSNNTSCWVDGNIHPAFGNFSRCPTITVDFYITVKVRAPIMEGTVAVDDSQHGDSAKVWKDQNGAGGGAITQNHQYIENNGSVGDRTIKRVRPNNKLCWWYQMNNKGPGPTLDQFDIMNFRSGSGNSDFNREFFDGNNLTPNNYFTMKINAYQSSGQWGCFDWGNKTMFKSGSANSMANISTSDATNRKFIYYPNQNDVGKTVCQRMRWSWNEGNGWNERQTPSACAYVPYHYPSCDSSKNNCDTSPPKDCKWNGTCPNDTVSSYGVVPTTSHNGANAVVMGDTVKFKYTITNNSSYTKTKPMGYTAYTFVLKGGQSIATAGGARSYTTNRAGGSYQDTAICGSGHTQMVRSINTSSQLRPGTPCTTPVSGSNLVVEPGKSWGSGEKSLALNGSYNNLQPGDQVCSYIVVNKWSVINDAEAPSVVASNVDCVKVGKRPQMQITGSDSYAGGGFEATGYSSNSLTGNNNRGSYSQYGLLTNRGAINNFGSSGWTTLANKGQACKLSYRNSNNSNTATSGCIATLGAGQLNRALSLPTMPASATRLTSGTVSNLSGLHSGVYYYDGSSDLIINSGTIPVGVNVTIYSAKGVRINGNIGYDISARRNDLTQLSSLTIVANSGDIKVDGAVSSINANLVAKNGCFISCADTGSSDLGIIGKCRNKLVINGAVVAKTGVQLRRTFGGGNANGFNQYDGNNIASTSEWFNYTPDVWLSGSAASLKRAPSSFTTTSVSSLPVRY